MAKKKIKQKYGKKSKQPKKSKAQEKRERRRKEQREQRRKEREKQRAEKERQKNKPEDEEVTNPDFYDEGDTPEGMDAKQWFDIKETINKMLSDGTLYYHAKKPARNLLNEPLEKLHEYNLAKNEEYKTYVKPILGEINNSIENADVVEW